MNSAGLRDDTSWRIVGNGRGRRHSRRRRLQPPPRCAPTIVPSAFSAQQIVASLRRCESALERSGFSECSLSWLERSIGWCIGDISVICYGIGRFSSSHPARLQLALLLQLMKRWKLTTAVLLYDPLLCPNERRALALLDIEVLTTNEEGKRRVESPTLFYMPHCGRALYNNVLWANWASNLGRVRILGNRLSAYLERPRTAAASSTQEDDATLHRLASVWTEVQCPAASSAGDSPGAFNDLCLHRFDQLVIDSQPKSFWEDRPAELLSSEVSSSPTLATGSTIIPASYTVPIALPSLHSRSY